MGLFDQLKAEAKKAADRISETVSELEGKSLAGQAAHLGQKATDQALDLRHKAAERINAYARTALPPGGAPPSPPPPPPASSAGAPGEANPGQAAPPPPPPAPQQEGRPSPELDLPALKAKAQQLFGQAKEKAASAKDSMVEKTDAAAIVVARKVSEKTGREVSPSTVKKVALAAGITLVAVGAIDLVAEAMAEGGLAEGGAEFAGGGAEATSSAAAGSGDVMDEAGRFFAENGGSLNIETVTVDIDGCEI